MIRKKSVLFNHLNSDQFSTFLYFYLIHALQEKNKNICDKIYYLNKTLNSIDLFTTEVAMPDIFLLVHPVGTVWVSRIF